MQLQHLPWTHFQCEYSDSGACWEFCSDTAGTTVRFVVVHRLFYSLNITWSPWTRSLNHHWPDIVLIRFQCVMDVVNTWCHAHVNRLQRSSWLCLADVFSTNIVWCGARWMYGSGFSSRWEDKRRHCQELPTVQLKLMLLSQDEFPSRTEQRKVILQMTITWVFHWQVHGTVPFGPEKCWISQKIVLFLNQN